MKVPDVVGKTLADALGDREAKSWRSARSTRRRPTRRCKVRSHDPGRRRGRQGGQGDPGLPRAGRREGQGGEGGAGGGARRRRRRRRRRPTSSCRRSARTRWRRTPPSRQAQAHARASDVFTDKAKAGELFGTDPPGGTKVAEGANVQAARLRRHPAGRLRQRQGRRPRQRDQRQEARDGREVPADEQEPSFTPAGSALAFVSGGQTVVQLGGHARRRDRARQPGQADDAPVTLTPRAKWRLPTSRRPPTGTSSRR